MEKLNKRKKKKKIVITFSVAGRMSVHIDSQTRNELPSTAGADHAYVPSPRSGGGGTKNGDLE